MLHLLFTPALAATWPDLSVPAAAEPAATADAALIVAIEDYFVAPDIPGARANGDDWYTWLVRSRGVPLSHVRVLRDGDAAREQILEEAGRAAGRLGPDGTLWVVFIGHGAPSKDGRDGLLVGVDAQPTATSLYARSVAQQELLEALGPARDRAVLVLDACFSGRGASGMLVPGLQPMIPTYALAPQGATVLGAGGPDQFAGPLPKTERPAFSYLALGALRGWADADGDGLVTASEVTAYTRGALSALVTDRTQEPWVVGPDRPLSRGGETGPDLLTIALGRPAPATPPAAAPSAPIPVVARPNQDAELADPIPEPLRPQGGSGHTLDHIRSVAQDAATRGVPFRMGAAWGAEGRLVPGVGADPVILGQRYRDLEAVTAYAASCHATVGAASEPVPCDRLRKLSDAHALHLGDLCLLVYPGKQGVWEVTSPCDGAHGFPSALDTGQRATHEGLQAGEPLSRAVELYGPWNDAGAHTAVWADLGLQVRTDRRLDEPGAQIRSVSVRLAH